MKKNEKTMHPGLKLVLDILPLMVFFVAFRLTDLITATAVLVVASLVSVGVTYLLTRTLSLAVMIGTGLVVIFGALTLVFKDELFIKMRPTMVNMLFASVLLIGAYGFKRGLLRYVLDIAFSLTAEGWVVLSKRWGFLFLALAIINECVWRTQTTEFWVDYKVFGVLAITMLFAISQMRTVLRHKINAD
jgi:intracellular septation protein